MRRLLDKHIQVLMQWTHFWEFRRTLRLCHF